LEWVCATGELGCNTGSYSPQRGPACFFPYGGWERSTSTFQLLLNLGGLESLAWVDDSFGEVPQGAVEGCPGSGIYVGRNPYGLGKVSKEQRAFFHAEDGKELWAKWYQVLVAEAGGGSVTISHLSYNWSSGWESQEEIPLS
ncbi:NATT4 protein, partial [Alcedo cyanopectus]|nr:NATT4 protein [Ceyx cyanopectus]